MEYDFARSATLDDGRLRMRILGMTAPEVLVMLTVYCIPLLVLYWVVRFAVKHGMKDALKDLGKGDEK